MGDGLGPLAQRIKKQHHRGRGNQQALPKAFQQSFQVTSRNVTLSPVSLGPGGKSMSPTVGLWQSGRYSLRHL